MKLHESSAVILCTILSHPSLQCDEIGEIEGELRALAKGDEDEEHGAGGQAASRF
ncbi:hypothetical protein BDM02DRAFT_3122536 [Thelephora ganbajun]|uniref:Uncharacterized protein n=1 Tax=Thelephora ganbajun TaxID=370292 RepID=A0ACB6Z2V4_THEGA|nr:hypothetical protein BDM02DRAFT_3122536 [Thelephora ganbajun]